MDHNLAEPKRANIQPAGWEQGEQPPSDRKRDVNRQQHRAALRSG